LALPFVLFVPLTLAMGSAPQEKEKTAFKPDSQAVAHDVKEKSGVGKVKELQDMTGEAFSQAIEDNSFFIEEAYNQETGVVQHIFNVVYFRQPQRDFVFTFTQEWPLKSITHQISFTVPYGFLNENTVRGIGDVILNYRYQMLTKEDWAAFSPRLSLIFPTGNEEQGLGLGSVGVQVNLPFSKRISNEFVTHVNAGFTLLLSINVALPNGESEKKSLSSYNIGASVIWLMKSNFNVMFEYLTNFNGEVDESGEITHSTETILSPGFRYAIDIGSLQVVPGVALPFSFTKDRMRVGWFFYLSFEHPF